MTMYGQFCPVAKAMEVLDERWTLLVVRELLAGSTHFNELRRGNPRMSPALLTKRLRSLERAGIVHRATAGGRTVYSLTPSGQELADIVNALGAWGVRWISHVGDEDLDPHLLMWDIRRTIDVGVWPRTRTVVAFRFEDADPASSSWWLVVSGDEPDVCDHDPGFDVTVTVTTTLRVLTRIWRGDVAWPDAVRSGSVVLQGPPEVRRAVPGWIGRGTFSTVPRPTEAAAARLSEAPAVS